MRRERWRVFCACGYVTWAPSWGRADRLRALHEQDGIEGVDHVVSVEGLTIQPRDAVFVSYHELAATMQARDLAAAHEDRARRMEKKEGRIDRIALALKPLAEEYRRTPFNQRAAFELIVLRALRRGGRV